MSAKLKLSVACGDYEIIRALKDGTVQADGLELVVLTSHGPRERHWRMARNLPCVGFRCATCVGG